MIYDQYLTNMIGEGEIDKAIKYLQKLSTYQEKEPEYRACLVMSGEYTRLKDEKLKNIISFDEYSLRINSIIDRLLQIGHELKHSPVAANDIFIIANIKKPDLIKDIERYFWRSGSNINILSTVREIEDKKNALLIFILDDVSEVSWQIIQNRDRKVAIIYDKGQINTKSLSNNCKSFRRGDYLGIHDLIRAIDEFFTGIVPVYTQSTITHNSNYELEIGYKANIPAIIHLLVGKALYKDRFIFIRELLQNSLDACVRRFGTSDKAQIDIDISTIEGYIDFKDNGCGISMNDFKGSFGVIGKNLPSIDTGQVKLEKIDIIGQFGIGFISVFMVSNKILISTKTPNEENIHCSITDVSKKFEFHKQSLVGRQVDDYGTTIRVFLNEQVSPEVILQKIKHYYRIYSTFSVSVDGLKAPLTNTYQQATQNKQLSLYSNRIFEAKLKLGFNRENIDNVVYCNSGFYINSDIEILKMENFPFLVGYINFRPKAIDLSIDRHSILRTEKLTYFYRARVQCILDLLIRKSRMIRQNISSQDNLINDVFEFRKLILKDDKDLFDIMNPLSEYLAMVYRVYNREDLIDINLKYFIDTISSIDDIIDLILDFSIFSINKALLTLREIINRSKYLFNKKLYYFSEYKKMGDGKVDKFYSDHEGKLIIKMHANDYTNAVRIRPKGIEKDPVMHTSYRKAIIRILFMHDIKVYKLDTSKYLESKEE